MKIKINLRSVAFLYLLFILSFNEVSGQRNNIWYFGDHAGLDFNSGSPVSLTNSVMYTFEGSATMSDTAGNLLFYTNGGPHLPNIPSAIWNRLHVPMPNGNLDSCSGCYSAGQSSLIIPDPGNSNRYYLFTVDCYENQFVGGLRFHIIDMTLDNGYGDVVVKDSLIVNNVTEALCGIRHANGTDYWIITHNKLTSSFNSVLLTSSGISAPFVTTVGPNLTFDFTTIKANCAGTKIVVCENDNYIYDFNNTTGVMSNPDLVNGDATAIGCEFSPSGQYLYLIVQTELLQYNLNFSNIPSSEQLIYTDPFGTWGQLTLGPDSIIYISRYMEAFLSSISNPDAGGLGCNFIDQAVTFTSGTCEFGLPNFVNDYSGGCISTGLTDEFNVANMDIHPNPVSDYLTISHVQDETVFTIADAAGRVVYKNQGNIPGSVTRIDVTDLSSGIYFLNAMSGQQFRQFKFIKL